MLYNGYVVIYFFYICLPAYYNLKQIGRFNYIYVPSFR